MVGLNELKALCAELNCAGEILQLRQKQKLLDEKRREALNNIIDIKGDDFWCFIAIFYYYFS